MKEYTLIIKSHCEAPDYEDSAVARTKVEAATVLAHRARIHSSEALLNMDDGEAV